MNMFLNKVFNKFLIAFIAIVILFSGALYIVFDASKADSECLYNSKNEPYCRVSGVVDTLYVNHTGLVVVKIKSNITKEKAKEFGFKIKNGTGFVMQLNATEASREMFSLLKLSHINGINVELHTHDVYKGYLQLDHIWLNK